MLAPRGESIYKIFRFAARKLPAGHVWAIHSSAVRLGPNMPRFFFFKKGARARRTRSISHGTRIDTAMYYFSRGRAVGEPLRCSSVLLVSVFSPRRFVLGAFLETLSPYPLHLRVECARLRESAPRKGDLRQRRERQKREGKR